TQDELGRGLTSLRDGMGSLIDALVRELRDSTIRIGTGTRGLERRGDNWLVHCTSGPAVEAECVILAAGPGPVAELVEDINPEAAGSLREITLASNVSVSLAYPRPAVSHPLEASGITVAAGESADGLRACAFSSSKFSGRAPEGHVLLRMFFRP